MFDLFSKSKNLTIHDVGLLIERFLSNNPRYPQEWNDFVETKQRRPESERYRRRCYELDPLANRPWGTDGAALAELRTMIASARMETYLDVAKTLEDFIEGTGGAWDWDDYTSAMSYPDDPYLQEIQSRMVSLGDEFPPGPQKGYCGADGIRVILDYIRDLRSRATRFGNEHNIRTS